MGLHIWEDKSMVNSKFLIAFLIFCIFCLSCRNEKEAETLIGNWYFLEYGNDTTYNEVYIDNANFLFYLDLQGFLPRQMYKISNDTISFYHGTKRDNFQTDYSKKLQLINPNKFLLIEGNDTSTYQRLVNLNYTLDSIKKEEDNSIFEYHFYKRRNLYFFNLGYNVDTALTNIVIEEEAIEPIK